MLRREQAIESADAVAEALASAAAVTPSSLPTAAALANAASTVAAREDKQFGGFGGAPKFPVATTLRFLQAPLVLEKPLMPQRPQNARSQRWQHPICAMLTVDSSATRLSAIGRCRITSGC